MSRIRIEIKANPSGDMVANWPGTAYRNPFLNAVVDVSQIRTIRHPEADE